jgi:hypothetical protein
MPASIGASVAFRKMSCLVEILARVEKSDL